MIIGLTFTLINWCFHLVIYQCSGPLSQSQKYFELQLYSTSLQWDRLDSIKLSYKHGNQVGSRTMVQPIRSLTINTATVYIRSGGRNQINLIGWSSIFWQDWLPISNCQWNKRPISYFLWSFCGFGNQAKPWIWSYFMFHLCCCSC